jgi:3-hydroxyisobutyrate dehydrogenase
VSSSETEKQSDYVVTVLGLGAMGLPMATRLTSRLTVHGFDIAAERLALAAEAGVRPFDSARAW